MLIVCCGTGRAGDVCLLWDKGGQVMYVCLFVVGQVKQGHPEAGQGHGSNGCHRLAASSPGNLGYLCDLSGHANSHAPAAECPDPDGPRPTTAQAH